MATMVKEKSRAKKKTKEKLVLKPDVQVEVPLLVDSSRTEEGNASTSANDLLIGPIEHPSSSSIPFAQEITDLIPTESTQNELLESSISLNVSKSEIKNQRLSVIESIETASISQNESLNQSQAYKDVCQRLDIVSFKDVPANCDLSIEQLESKIESTSYLNTQRENENTISSENVSEDIERAENVMPSAPVFDEELAIEPKFKTQEESQEIKLKVQCMPLEVAMQVYGGKEMAEIREMSKREEAIVEAGSLSGPEHPLVDLLSTFRCSVNALEQERHKVIQGYADEEKHRAALWKVEKRTVSESKECSCGQTVWFKGKYDHAELLKSKLPAARLRLEGLLKDVQESFCHHQHAAFLAYFQIEEFISETLQSSKSEIRAATALVLHELRMCDSAPALGGMLCGALRRWAAALCGRLVDARDPSHLLFLLHQLFRQSRSVRWAAPLIKIPMCDSSDAARALALLELLLAGPTLESARECTEENTEMWEELDKHGGGGAVSEGALRERDLLALLRAFPLRALTARLVLLARADISQTREYEWHQGGRDVVRALCGVRALLGTLQRAAGAHAQYPRLRAALRALARPALHAAAALHQHNKESYSEDVARHIEAELEALFVAGWWAEAPPPASLLRPAARAAYCAALVARLHEKSPHVIEHLSLELPAAPCERTVAVIAQAAVDCEDHELARTVLDFLAQTALGRKSPACAGACAGAARACLPRLLRAHDYLYATTLHIVAEFYQVASLQPSPTSLNFLKLQRWRPSTGEVRGVLEDWSQRCPQLIQYLLQELSYTPYDGLSLEAQLTVGSWLCAQPAPAPDWAWTVLTRLRVHRSSWQLPLDAPPPEHTRDVFQQAYAVLSSSWGHSVPLICEYGVGALWRVAAARAPAAAHALPLVMAAMASSPESVSLTPRFAELAGALLSPPSLLQWARGAPAAAPDLLLRRLLAQIEAQPMAARGAAAAAWMRALRGAALAGAPLAACDAVLLAARRPTTLQEAPKPEVLAHLVRNAQHAPLACEEALRAAHAHRERDTQLFDKLLRALAVQRANNHKIHVDKALKKIGSSMGSEELVIYQAATAALAAPMSHPAHLALWTLLMHLYLHTHTNTPDTPPIGPLFFDGFTKSSVLAQIKRRLQDTIIYHQMQVDSFKSLLNASGPKPSSSTVPKSKSVSPMDNLLPELSIAELVGESSDSSDSEETNDSDDDRSDRDNDKSVSESEERRRVNVNMLKYHEAAEKMLREFVRWLEAGSRLRATPHHADLARYIPDPALQTAWAEQLRSTRRAPAAADDDLRAPRAPPAPAPPRSALHTAVRWILKIGDRAGRRSRVPVMTSPVDDVNFGNKRELYCLVDKHLNCIEAFAKQWSVEASTVSQLDDKLWPLVGALRVRFPLSPIARSCSKKCAPVILPLQGHYEWRISEGAAGGIRDNRSSARAALRALCRARPQVACTAAALNTIARRIRTLDAAVGVAERAWGCAGAAPDVAPARAALVALLDALADRWLCSDAEAVCALVSAWSARACSPAQEALSGALVARAARGAPAAARPRLYTALLRALPGAVLSPQRAFSYLSKFDVSRVCCDEAQRGDMLHQLLQAAQCWGREPAPDRTVLVELIGVQTAALTTAPHLRRVVLASARAAAAGRLPLAPLAHVARAAACAAPPFDQLGHILRELGVIWWEARAQLKETGATYHVEYAPHIAVLQHALQRAFVAAACALSYTPERVSWYAWAALQESWAAWIAPHPSLPPLLPSAADRPEYPAMLKHFVDNLHQIMLDCPGCEEHLLSQVWAWTAQTCLAVRAPAAGDSRTQLADLLLELGALPWREHQWWRANCQPAALQLSASTEVEMQTWLKDTVQGIEAATWLRDVADCEVAPRLAALLQLFAGPLRLRAETLEQAAQLPWDRLPEVALDQALERFFVEHHNPLLPYHDAPQFRVILAASGLSASAARARGRRACAVSQWTRAASAPALLAHVAAHSRAALALIAALEPYVEESSDELEELLSRAVVIMCMEPAAGTALPVWERWVGGATRRCAGACVCAARALTSLEYFAPLADAAVAAFLDSGGSWSEASARLRGGGWAEPAAQLARARLHAAYALALAAPGPPALPTTLNYSEKELIVSVWICVVCRAALRGSAGGSAGGAGAARALLAKWAEPPRLAILRVLGGADQPTDKHRLLSRLALCIIAPGSEPLIKAYESACPGVLGSHSDAHSWARAPTNKLLPMLAVKLFPAAENYFAEEIKMAAAL